MLMLLLAVVVVVVVVAWMSTTTLHADPEAATKAIWSRCSLSLRVSAEVSGNHAVLLISGSIKR